MKMANCPYNSGTFSNLINGLLGVHKLPKLPFQCAACKRSEASRGEFGAGSRNFVK